jgi:hypothetical protein
VRHTHISQQEHGSPPLPPSSAHFLIHALSQKTPNVKLFLNLQPDYDLEIFKNSEVASAATLIKKEIFCGIFWDSVGFIIIFLCL